MADNYLDQFQDPGAEFRGKPFWAWNCRLDREQLLEQLDCFKEMGMGGATIHCRTGLDTEYLGEEYLDDVKACVEKAEREGMKIGLYDEDRWPSGFGGGKVTADPAFRSRYLVLTPYKNDDRIIEKVLEEVGSTAGEKAKGHGRLLARYEICLEDGKLKSYHRLAEGEEGDDIWYAYLELSENTPWYNNQTYVNTLDKKAIERFVEVTHEVYKDEVGSHFGKTIPSIFTDEPQFVHKTCLGRADERKDLVMPYTDDFEDTYQKTYRESFLEYLPEIFWERQDGKVSVARYRYHDHVTERFADAYADTLGNWCKGHGIALTGHMMEEPTLESQTHAIGEAMRHYRSFDIPGIDMLCDWREYATAKQAQSAAHQMGKTKITSELYGVTGWDYEFRGHKEQGDWQAALGVTERVHHLSWVSMEGEAKRDYPASIFFQSPWYKKYSLIETYFARLNTALQSGKPSVRVAVIHPIESYWLHFGPREQTASIREKLEKQFRQVTQWLLFGLIDFDFVSESLMQDLSEDERKEKGRLSVGRMNYDAVVIPGCETLRGETVRRLTQMAEEGGKVIIMGEEPKYIEAVENEERLHVLAEKSTLIRFDREELLDSLEAYRQIDMTDDSGVRSDQYLSQIREIGSDRIVFLAKGITTENKDIPKRKDYRIRVKGNYRATVYDAMTGEKSDAAVTWKQGSTILNIGLYDQDSLLLYLKEADAANSGEAVARERKVQSTVCLSDINAYKSQEPNVLLLDQAEFSLDEGVYEPREETLRIDNILRERLDYPRKMDALAQPWVQRSGEVNAHTLKLRYEIVSETELEGCFLALENAENTEVSFNGERLDGKAQGYYVDPHIAKLCLPKIHAGKNELVLKSPYHAKSNLEWCYILGDFGVEVYGNKSRLVRKPEQIGFADLSRQKFPFYGGNMEYETEVNLEDGEYELQISKFRSPVIEVFVDGAAKGTISMSPYKVSLGRLSGTHTLKIVAYGNRYNTFGALHLCNEQEIWHGPNAWRSRDEAYSYEYQLKPSGILAAPRLIRL